MIAEPEFSTRDYVFETSPGAMVLEPDTYDSALLGVVEKINMEPVACYDWEKLIEAAMEMGIESRQDAIDHLDFNVAGSLGGQFHPVILYRP